MLSDVQGSRSWQPGCIYCHLFSRTENTSFCECSRMGGWSLSGPWCIRRKDTTGSSRCLDIGNCTVEVILCSLTPRILLVGWLLKTVSLCSVAQADLKGHGLLLTQPSRCWDYRPVTPHQLSLSVFHKTDWGKRKNQRPFLSPPCLTRSIFYIFFSWWTGK